MSAGERSATSPLGDRTDLIVVGGGPAGLATAIRARLAGMAVTVVERFSPPIDKACGEGLMPDAVANLREIGVEPRGLPFRGVRYFDGGAMAEGVFPRQQGLGVRRLELHRALADRAEGVGVRLLWGVKALGLAGERVETAEGLLQGRFVVGADGLNSHIRRWAGLAKRPSKVQRFGVRRHYAVAPWSEFVEVYWGPRCEAYVTPVADDEVGVALLWGDGKADFDTLMASIPQLQKRLAGAEIRSRDRGAGPFHQKVGKVHRGCVALVGDAAGYLDAITGEGLAVALHESKALVESLERGDLGRYARLHRRINRLPNRMTSVVLALEKRPALRQRAIRALAAEPALFSRLLGIHARSLPVRDLGVGGALRLARLLLAPG